VPPPTIDTSETTTSDHPARAYARRLFRDKPIERHPLLERLGAGRLDDRQARAIALQIHHVVDCFPRLLAALLANVPDWRLRMPLVDNLFEEHGRMKPERVHVETHKLLLHGLGIGVADLGASEPSIPVLVYTRALLDLTGRQRFGEGLGALAVIEEIVARASPIVAGYAASRGVARASAKHFTDHAVLDISHADEIYALAAVVWDSGESARRDVERGMDLGWYYHRRLYSDLLRCA